AGQLREPPQRLHPAGGGRPLGRVIRSRATGGSPARRKRIRRAVDLSRTHSTKYLDLAQITVPMRTTQQAARQACAWPPSIAHHAWRRGFRATEAQPSGSDPQAVACFAACWLVLNRALIWAKL